MREERLWSLMAACDAIVSLRSPTMGETSGLGDPRAVARQAARRLATSAGSPSCPTTSAIKVPVDEHEVEALAAALERLAADPAAREAMGARRPRARRARARPAARRRPVRRRARAGRGRRGRPRRDAARGRRGRRRRRASAPTTRPPRELAARLRRGRAWRLRRRSPARARDRASSLARAIPVWAWLAGIVVLSTGIRYAFTRQIVAPWIMVDELIYSELAKSFAAARPLPRPRPRRPAPTATSTRS